MNAVPATYQIVYNGKNITGDISPYVLSFSYSDKSEGESDEIEILMEDKGALWQNEWYPSKGDTVTASIIDETGTTLDCGTFTVDEITGSVSRDGDTFSIKALAAGITKNVRTKKSYAHENKTLREIANTVAAKQGLAVQGNIDNISVGRITQYRENDLKFLKRISNEYGYTFSVRGKVLVFTNVFEIENKQSVLTVYRQDITGAAFTDKTSDTYQGANVSYHNPKQKEVISYQHTENTEAFKTAKPDTLELRCRAENKQQADIKGKVALYRANSMQQQGNIEMKGNVFALAGNNLEINEVGMFSGAYYICSSTHSISKDGGYITSMEVKRVGLVTKEKQKKNG